MKLPQKPRKPRWLDRNHRAMLPADVRVKTLKEYILGFSPLQSFDESDRCLKCRDSEKRCSNGCPANMPIPKFMEKVQEHDLIGAFRVIVDESHPFPSITGRVCPQDRLCEGSCILHFDTVRKRENIGSAVSIGAVERWIGDTIIFGGFDISDIDKVEGETGKTVSIIGAGPAGLSAAYYLRRKGHRVKVYDMLPSPGGLLISGIPSFRLDRYVIEFSVNRLKNMGVEFIMNTKVGEDIDVEEIRSKSDAIFIAAGVSRGKVLNIPGAELEGVYSALEWLREANLSDFESVPDVGERAMVVGGGFTAMDVAMCLNRLDVKNFVVYRGTRETSSAKKEEWDHIAQEGSIIHFNTQPVEIIGSNGKVEAVKTMATAYALVDGKRRMVCLEGTERYIEVDSIIFAVGQNADPVGYRGIKGIELDRWQTVPVDENYMTNVPGVFAGGDVITGAGTVVEAFRDGRRAALSIDRYLSEA